jgi:hypothetical protein
MTADAGRARVVEAALRAVPCRDCPETRAEHLKRALRHEFVPDYRAMATGVAALLEAERGAHAPNGVGEAEAQRLEAIRRKDAAYTERNQCVALLAALFPSSLERHPDSDTTWDDDWRWIVYIDLPTGQVSWHLHDSHLAIFHHVPRFQGRAWDGHTTEEKYKRVAAVAAQPRDLGAARQEAETLRQERDYWRDLWGAVERQAEAMAKQRDTTEAALAQVRAALDAAQEALTRLERKWPAYVETHDHTRGYNAALADVRAALAASPPPPSMSHRVERDDAGASPNTQRTREQGET